MTISLAPASVNSSHRFQPTLPKPCTDTVLPVSVALPKRCLATQRIALKIPRAVMGEGSPDANSPSASPATNRVSRASSAMSAGVMPMSSAVQYRPSHASIARAKACNNSGVFSTLGSPKITALPPPNGKPAAAFL